MKLKGLITLLFILLLATLIQNYSQPGHTKRSRTPPAATDGKRNDTNKMCH